MAARCLPVVVSLTLAFLLSSLSNARHDDVPPCASQLISYVTGPSALDLCYWANPPLIQYIPIIDPLSKQYSRVLNSYSSRVVSCRVTRDKTLRRPHKGLSPLGSLVHKTVRYLEYTTSCPGQCTAKSPCVWMKRPLTTLKLTIIRLKHYSNIIEPLFTCMHGDLL